VKRGPQPKSRALFGEGSQKRDAVNRLAGALVAYAVLGILAWATLGDPRVRAVTLAILAMFAVKSWLRRKEVMHADGDAESESDRQ